MMKQQLSFLKMILMIFFIIFLLFFVGAVISQLGLVNFFLNVVSQFEERSEIKPRENIFQTYFKNLKTIGLM